MVEWIDTAMRILHTATGSPPAFHIAASLADFSAHDPTLMAAVGQNLRPAELRGEEMLPDPLPLPTAVRDALLARIAPLDAATRRVLTMAAHLVIDRADVLVAASAVDITVLLNGHVTGELDFRDGRYRFRDERLRAALRAPDSSGSLRDIHRSLSRAAASYGETTAAHWHALRAGITPRTLRAPLRSAELLLRAGHATGAYALATEIATHAAPDIAADAHVLAGRAALSAGCARHAATLFARATAATDPATRTRARMLEDATRRIETAGGSMLPLRDAWIEALSQSAASATETAVLERMRTEAALVATEPDGADATQAVTQLTLMRAPDAWPWPTTSGRPTPATEALVRVRTIARTLRHGDVDTAVRLADGALSRLPLAAMLGGDDAATLQTLTRHMPGETAALARALALPPGDQAVRRGRPRHSARTAAAARLDTPAVPPTTEQATHRAVRALSPREHQVLSLVLEGRRNIEIADALDISHRTVEVHVSSLLRKLGARSRVELVATMPRRGERAQAS